MTRFTTVVIGIVLSYGSVASADSRAKTQLVVTGETVFRTREAAPVKLGDSYQQRTPTMRQPLRDGGRCVLETGRKDERGKLVDKVRCGL